MGVRSICELCARPTHSLNFTPLIDVAIKSVDDSCFEYLRHAKTSRPNVSPPRAKSKPPPGPRAVRSLQTLKILQVLMGVSLIS